MDAITKAGVTVSKDSLMAQYLEMLDTMGIQLDRVNRAYTVTPETDPLNRIGFYYNRLLLQLPVQEDKPNISSSSRIVYKRKTIVCVDTKCDPPPLDPKTKVIRAFWYAIQAEQELELVPASEKQLATTLVRIACENAAKVLEINMEALRNSQQLLSKLAPKERKKGVEQYFRPLKTKFR